MCNLKRIAFGNIAFGIALSSLVGCVSPTEDTSTISSAHATERDGSEVAEPGGEATVGQPEGVTRPTPASSGQRERAGTRGPEGFECAVGPESAEGLQGPIDLGQLQGQHEAIRERALQMNASIRAQVRANILRHREQMMRRMLEMRGPGVLERPDASGGAEEPQAPGGSEGQRTEPGTD